MVSAESDTIHGVPFSRAKEIILSQNAGLKSVTTEIEAAKELVSQVGTLPNPEVGLSLDNFGTEEIEISFEQTIELGNQRHLRKDAAHQETEAAVNIRNHAQLNLETEIIKLFIPIAIAEKKLLVLDSIIRTAENTRDQIQIRVENGGLRRTDLIRAEIEIEKLKLERRELVSEAKRSRMRFAALGKDSSLIHVYGEVSDDQEIPPITTLHKALYESPDLKSFQIQKEQLIIQKKLLGAEAIPNISVSAGYARNNSEKTNSPLIGFSMGIPLFNNNAAAQRNSELRLKSVLEQRENTLRQLEVEVDDIHSKLIEADDKIKSLSGSTINKAEQVCLLMQEYYEAGNADFLDLSEARAELLQLRMELYDIQTERAQNLADLMRITSLNIQVVK